MRIGLIDVDGHNFPNLALMKISAWHKQNGDSVEWYSPLWSGHMDRVYMSKVFSFTPDYEHFIDADEILGGAADTLYRSRTERKSSIKAKTRNCRMRSNTSTQTILCTPICARTLHMDS